MAKRATAKTRGGTAKTRGGKSATGKRRGGSNTYARWSRDEIKKLRQLAKDNLPTSKIGAALGRTAIAIQGKAQREGISLRSTVSSAAARIKRGAKRMAKRR